MVSCFSLLWKYRLSSKTHYNKLQSKTNTWCKFHIHPSPGRLLNCQFKKLGIVLKKTVLNHINWENGKRITSWPYLLRYYQIPFPIPLKSDNWRNWARSDTLFFEVLRVEIRQLLVWLLVTSSGHICKILKLSINLLPWAVRISTE